jgi:hypothetical protein
MGDISEALCAFCNAVMRLAQDLPETADSAGLRYFSCDSCGAGEWRRTPGDAQPPAADASDRREQ